MLSQDRLNGSAHGDLAVDTVFSGLVKGSLISRKAFLASVTSVRTASLELARVRWRGVSRRIVVQRVPSTSTSRKLDEPLDPGDFDPWTVDAESLPQRTLRRTLCRYCGGDKKVVCSDCGGSQVVTCPDCRATGRVISARTGNSIQCPSCRGRGQRKCACKSGRVSCPGCEGKGKVDEWFEVAESSFDRTTETESPLARALVAPTLVPERTWRGNSVGEAPEDIQLLLRRPDLLPRLNPREDRLKGIQVEVFRGELTTVEYQLFGVSGSVDVQGWDLALLENPTTRAPLSHRRRRLVTGAVVACAFGLALAFAYGARHPFLFTTPSFGWLLALALLAGLAVTPLLDRLALPSTHRGKWTVASVPLLLVALGQGSLALTGGPEVEHARELARAGRVQEALTEASACVDLKIDEQQARQLHDRLQLEQVAEVHEPKAAWEAAARPFYTASARNRAREHALEVTARAAAAQQAEGNFDGSADLLVLVPEELSHVDSIHRLSWEVRDHRVGQLWEELQSAGDLDAKLGVCPRIRHQAALLEDFPEPPEAPSISPAQVEKACERLMKQKGQELKRQRDREERERLQEERSRQAAYRAWANAPLLCGDGSPSPSCLCGESSHRGCCSHHRGVAGCTKDYPN